MLTYETARRAKTTSDQNGAQIARLNLLETRTADRFPPPLYHTCLRHRAYLRNRQELPMSLARHRLSALRERPASLLVACNGQEEVCASPFAVAGEVNGQRRNSRRR